MAVSVRYVDVGGAAEYLRVSASFLNQLRVKGGGPRFVKCGRLVRYSLESLDQWMGEREVSSTSEAAR